MFMPRSLLPVLLAVFLTIGSVAAQTPELGSTINPGGTGVTFRVWAPNAQAVSVTGEFNNWSTTAHPLAQEAGTPWNGIWRTTVPSAQVGQLYKYHLRNSAGENVWRKDPRGREVRSLPDSTQASVIYDPEAFDWEGDAFVPPWPNDIVMYELHIGTFHDPRPDNGEPATFDDAIERLDYLAALGVNMIALMPVHEFDGRHSWGYNPTDLFAVAEAYGGPDGLKRFVKAAHERGMGVQVDVVHNHYDGKTDLINFDGPQNPYFYTAPGISTTPWGPRPRFADPNVQQFIADNVRMWLDEYKIWALRWDSPRNITGYDSTGDGEPNMPIPEAVTMMQNIHTMISSRSPRYYSISEDANVPGNYHGHWEVAFHNYLLPQLLPRRANGTFFAPFDAALPDRSLEQLAFRLEEKDPPGFRVIFSDNHDKSGDLNQATDGKRLAEDLDPTDPTSWAARKKTMLAAAVTLTSAGTPMLFMGQEHLADGLFGAYEIKDWRRAGRYPEIIRFHRDLIRMRRNLDGRTRALTFVGLPEVNDLRGNTRVVYRSESNQVIIYERSTDNAAETMLVAVNFSATDRFFSFNFPAAGPWHVHLNSDAPLYGADFRNVGPAVGQSINTSGGNNSASLTVPALSVLILGKTQPVAFPADANNNGLDDGWEILYGVSDPAGDDDHDGFTNLEEFLAGTDPTVPDRVSLPGSFNDWNITARNMRWDRTRDVWRYMARFDSPGVQTCKAYLQDGWVAGADYIFTVGQPGTFEITYDPTTGQYTHARVDTDTNGNGLADAWEAFYFYPATSADPATDPDGDGFTNLEEFLRGSDPTDFDYPALGVVGGFNGWNWAARNMRYAGHGVWTYAVAFRTAPTDRNFKFGMGPDNTDPNWGQPTERQPTGLFSPVDFLWPESLTGWHLVRFNEKNFVMSVSPLAGAPDFDGDGMPDAWERYFGLDPFSDDAQGDLDGDGVWNLFEYQRLTWPDDPSDHFAAMHVPGRVRWNPADPSEALWNPADAGNRMVWNPANARWEYVVFTPRAREIEFKFAAGEWGNGTWGWAGNGMPGVAQPWADGNIRAQLPARGHYLIRFEEAAGTYDVVALPVQDSNGNGLPDAWERFYFAGLSSVDPAADADGDGLSNLDEFRRGSHPQMADTFSTMRVVGDVSGWSFETLPMRWNRDTLRWELLLRTTDTAINQRVKFVAGGDWNQPNWGDTGGNGEANRSGDDMAYDVGVAPAYLWFALDDYSLTYAAGSMPLNDETGDGLPDLWAAWFGVSGASGNPDGDPFTNLEEYLRGSDPTVPDTYFANYSLLRVVGTFTGWNVPTSPQMQLVGDHLWQLDMPLTMSGEFKFVAGNEWSAPNWGVGNTDAVVPFDGAGTYRFTLDDRDRSFNVRRLTNSFADSYPGLNPLTPVRGQPALLDYLFGGTAETAPAAEHLPVQTMGNGTMRLSFVTRDDAANLHHRVLGTSDLRSGHWSEQEITALPSQSVGPDLTRHTYEVPLEAGHYFLKIEAILD